MVDVSKIKSLGAALLGGDWVESKLFEGVSYRLTGRFTAAARDLRRRLIAALPEKDRGSAAVEDAIDLAVLRQECWKGVAGLTREGAPLDIEQAKALLDDPEIAEALRIDLLDAAQRLGAKQLAEAEADAKN
jgi:hypothetical protein